MDIRIVNTCNNNCLYCLEQSYRKKENFIGLSIIKNIIGDNPSGDKIINFYGGNPLLYPKLLEIVHFSKTVGYESIGILSNSYGLNKELIDNLKNFGLSSFGIYFNSFDEKINEILTGGGLGVKDILSNIKLIKETGIFLKIIIHINKQNIKDIEKIVFYLNKYFGIQDFEFINYFPFDRPYEKYKNILFCDYNSYKNNISKLLLLLKNLKIKVKFYKFSQDFFGQFKEFYNYEDGILKQIGKEDSERLNKGQTPFCLKQKRCKYCFIKDNCIFYGL